MDHHSVIYIEAFFATNMLHFNGPIRQITFLCGGDTPYWLVLKHDVVQMDALRRRAEQQTLIHQELRPLSYLQPGS